MTQAVKDFLTAGNQFCRESLDCAVKLSLAGSAVMDDREHKSVVGERLRLTREALGYPVAADFARRYDIDRGKLSNWERGLNYPPPLFVKKLWETDRVTADWIYLGIHAGLPYSTAANLLGVLSEK